LRKLHVVAALTLLAAGALAAQTPPQPKPPNGSDPVEVIGQRSPKSKIVCETFVPTGSLRPQKICTTQAEFDAVRNQSLIELQRLRDRQQRNWQMRETCKMVGGC